jgi:molybdopterin converting factor small subunit
MNATTITVKLFGTLRGRMESDQKVIISDNETIHTVIERLSIDPQAWYLFSVNGQQAGGDTQLHDGDVLMIVPPISGG